MTVLIIEDDKVLSLLLSKMVEKLGYTIVGIHAKGSEAISKAIELKPDVILMDIMLEDEIDGIQATKEFQKSNTFSKVIYITGNSDSYNRERAKKTTYVDYLIKPVSLEDLRKTFTDAEL